MRWWGTVLRVEAMMVSFLCVSLSFLVNVQKFLLYTNRLRNVEK